MKTIIDQINNIQIEEEKISSENKRLKNQIKKGMNSYQIRILKVDNNVVQKVDNLIDKINCKNLNKANIDENGMYCTSSKLPKEKGITIKMKFRDNKQKSHIIYKISNMYEDYKINEDNNYIELIGRK